jgi:hypothetical protein
VQARADSNSVRAVAIEIGHTSLEKFLDGSSPFAKNRTLIVEWFLREHEMRPTREPMPVPVDLQVQVVQTHPGACSDTWTHFCPSYMVNPSLKPGCGSPRL